MSAKKTAIGALFFFILSFAALVGLASYAVAAPKDKGTTVQTDDSDLNLDGVVDAADLGLFSTEYLKEDVGTVDWCAFWLATHDEERLYKRQPDFYLKHFNDLMGFMYNEYACDGSDFNFDGVVDDLDLWTFSTLILEQNVDDVEWCQVYEYTSLGLRVYGKFSPYFQEHYKLLLGYIYDRFGCTDDFLKFALENTPKHLSRITQDKEVTGNHFVSDPVVGSVFVFDPNRLLVGEIRNLQRPLGIAIDSQGYLLVGNDKVNHIEVYDPANGDLLYTFGEGLLHMPNAITVSPSGDIYVTDSRNHNIQVFDNAYLHVRTIGEPGRKDGQLRFPVDTEVIGDRVYVADQGNRRIKVFDLHGNYVREIAPPLELSIWCLEYGFFCPSDARGTFIKLLALDSDASGRLHVLDVFEAAVSVIDPVTGALVGAYGTWGDGQGEMRTAMDLLINEAAQAVVTDSKSDEMEVFPVP